MLDVETHEGEATMATAFARVGFKTPRQKLIYKAHLAIDAHPRHHHKARQHLYDSLSSDAKGVLEFWSGMRDRLLDSILRAAVRERHDVTKVMYGPDQLQRAPRMGTVRPKSGAHLSSENQCRVAAAAQTNGVAGKDHRVADNHIGGVHPATPSADQIKANRKVAQAVAKGMLRSYLVNGQHLENVTKRELLDSATADAKNMRFKELIASRLPTDETKVGDCLTGEDVAKIWDVAKDPNNE